MKYFTLVCLKQNKPKNYSTMKHNFPKITQPSEAMRWNFWMKLDFYKPHTFPDWVVTLLIKTHLKHFEGYHLFYFMTANGFDTTTMCNILENFYTYDKYKTKHLLKQSKTSNFNCKKYFDLIERDIVYPEGSIIE